MKKVLKGQLGILAKVSRFAPKVIDPISRQIFERLYPGSLFSRFLDGTKPMIWDPVSEPLMLYYKDSGINLDTFKGHHWSDFTVNKDKLLSTIQAYKPLYTHRLKLDPNSTPELIYDYLKANSLEIFNGYINGGNYHDLLGLSLGYGPKDAILFSTLSNPDLIDTMYKGVDSAIPAMLSKRLRLGKFILHQSDINGDHMGYTYIPFKSELDWSPQSWLSKRPVGTGPYTKEEAAALATNVPEYLNIEMSAKQNGTWLHLPDGTLWEGDPREWVMMQSKNYKEFVKNSLLKDNYTHESNNWKGNLVVSGLPAISGKLFGDGFYLFHNPTGVDKTTKTIYTVAANRLNKPTSYNVVIDSRSPTTFDPTKDKYADFFIEDRNSPARVGSFHYPLYEKYNPYEFFDPRLENDVLILDGAWKGKNKIVTGFSDQPYAYPNIKFVTGNTGEFSTSPKLIKNIFRGFIPAYLLTNTLSDNLQ